MIEIRGQLIGIDTLLFAAFMIGLFVWWMMGA